MPILNLIPISWALVLMFWEREKKILLFSFYMVCMILYMSFISFLCCLFSKQKTPKNCSLFSQGKVFWAVGYSLLHFFSSIFFFSEMVTNTQYSRCIIPYICKLFYFLSFVFQKYKENTKITIINLNWTIYTNKND